MWVINSNSGEMLSLFTIRSKTVATVSKLAGKLLLTDMVSGYENVFRLQFQR